MALLDNLILLDKLIIFEELLYEKAVFIDTSIHFFE